MYRRNTGMTRQDYDLEQRLLWRLVLGFLKEGPCMDCGRKFPQECMDFDHVRGKKLCNFNGNKISKKKMEEEISKCELVCANCHRIRTRVRMLQ